MFAKALTDGDIAKLIKMMEDGKIKLPQIEKVIEYMKTIVDPKLLQEQANTPTKKFEAMRTAWVRMLEAMNRAGLLDVMVTAFEEVTKLLVGLEGWVHRNKKELIAFKDVVKDLYKTIKAGFPILLSLFAMFKVWKVGLAAVTAYRAAIIALGVSSAATGAALGTVLNSIRAFAGKTALTGFFILLWDLIETLNGKKTLFSEAMFDDNSPILKWLSRGIVLTGELIALMGKLGIALAMGDAGFATESIDRFRSAINELAPSMTGFVDGFMRTFLWTFNLIGNYVNRAIMGFQSLWEASQFNFSEASAIRSSMELQPILPTAAQMWSVQKYISPAQQGQGAPLRNPISIGDVSVTVQGSGITDPQALQNLVTNSLNEVFEKTYTQGLANYPQLKQ
jgi:hypothetical protein